MSEKDKPQDLSRELSPFEPATDADRPSAIVPITRLRQYYEVLRLFGEKKVYTALLGATARHPAKLTELFEDSYKHFSRYTNPGEPFVDPQTPRTKLAEDDKFARNLLFNICSAKTCNWEEDETLAFEFVDYEVSPLRTQRAHFEDGRPASKSGTGGMDLLLRSRDSKRPIIGEIKAKGDTNLFLALIQCLTYAVEMITPAQRLRLKKHHGFVDLDPALGGPLADVYILFQSGTDAKISQSVFALTETLWSTESALFSRAIGRIVFLEFADGSVSSLRSARSYSKDGSRVPAFVRGPSN